MPHALPFRFTPVASLLGVFISLSGVAQAGTLPAGIQMLPPMQSGAACPAGLSRVLTWDGQTPINCSSGFTIDQTTGNVSVSGSLGLSGSLGFGNGSIVINPSTDPSVGGSNFYGVFEVSPSGWININGNGAALNLNNTGINIQDSPGHTVTWFDPMGNLHFNNKSWIDADGTAGFVGMLWITEDSVSFGKNTAVIYPNGNAWFAGNGAFASVNCGTGCSPVSDMRLKTDVQKVDRGLDTIMALRPVTWVWKDGAKNEMLVTDTDKMARKYGFVAQDVEKVLPDLVIPVHMTAAMAQNEPKGLLSLDYMGIVAPLVKAVQEQQAEIKTQQGEIEALKAELAKGQP